MELLKEIYENDIGLNIENNIETLYSVRKAARIVLFNENNDIAILKVKKGNYHKLPGGGIEFGENIQEALIREVKEEVGASLNIKGELGIIIEYKKQHQQLQISYCYYGYVKGVISAPNFTELEKENGFGLTWIKLNDAISSLEKDLPDNYIGKFIQKRDLNILYKAKKILNM